MSVRQRLRSKFQDKEAQRVCWYCTLGSLRHQRYASTAFSASLLRTGNRGLDGFAALSHEIGQRLLRKDLGPEISHQRQRRTLPLWRRRPRALGQSAEEQHIRVTPKIRYHGSHKQPRMARLDIRNDAVGNSLRGIQKESADISEHISKADVKTVLSAGQARSLDPFSKVQTLGKDESVTINGEETQAEWHLSLEERSCISTQDTRKPRIVDVNHEISSSSSTHESMSSNINSRRHRSPIRVTGGHRLKHNPRALEALPDHTQTSSEEANSSRIKAMQAHLKARARSVEQRPYSLRKHAVFSNRTAYRTFPAMQEDWRTDDTTASESSKDNVKENWTLQTDNLLLPLCSSSTSSKTQLDHGHVDGVAGFELDSVLDAYRDLDRARYETSTTPSPVSLERSSRSQTSSLRRAASLYYQNLSLTRTNGSIRQFAKGSLLTCSNRSASTSVSKIETYNLSASYFCIKAQKTTPISRPNGSSDIVDSKDAGDIYGSTIRERLRLWRKYQDRCITDSVVSTVVHGQLGPHEFVHNMKTVSGEDTIDPETLREDNLETDQHEFDLHGDTLELNSNASIYLKKGDMVEFRTSNEPILAIFVRNLREQSQFYTEQGQWLHRSSTKVHFAVSEFVSAHELDGIVPFLPSEDIASESIGQLQPIHISAPRGTGAGIVRKMQIFHIASDDVFRQHADRLSRAYELVAPQHYSSGRRHITLEQVALKVLQKTSSELTSTMLWAVHRTLCRAQNVVPDGRSHHLNPGFEFFPIANLDDIERVRDWAREYQESVIGETIDGKDPTGSSTNPMMAFILKARIAIKRSRANRNLSPIGGLGPSLAKQEPQSPNMSMCSLSLHESLTASEKMIISYMDAWVTSRYLNSSSNLKAIGPMILRAVAMYDGLSLDEGTGFTFLQELGVVRPWENRTVHSPGTRLPGHDVYHPTTKLHEQARRSLSSFEVRDSMAGMRRDWGDLAVFCIDSADTIERDDGVSLQSIIDEPCSHWIHVHVANPSAFITPDSAFAHYAADLSESVYLPEQKYPMLEPLLTRAYFGLGMDRPCITFSAKVNARGEILEKEISHGIIHNVHYVTPQKINRELNINASNDSDATSVLVVGGDVQEEETKETKPEDGRKFSPADVETLSKLRELGEATRHRRQRGGGINFNKQTEMSREVYPEVYLSRQPVSSHGIMLSQFGHYTGDPVISIKRSTHALGAASIMVADLMILAGEVVAQWSKERNLPIPYRGIARNPEPYKSPEAFRCEILEPQIERYGHADVADLKTFMKLLGNSIYSASPLEHTALGLTAYCQVTSPLRRYADMFAHWQIEAALRHESYLNAGDAVNEDDAHLPFSYAQVDTVSKEITNRKHNIRNLQLSSKRHWLSQALFRAFYFKEAQLPEFFKVVMSHLGIHGQYFPEAWIDGWGIVVQMLQLPSSHPQGSYKIGDHWKAKIASIDPYYSRIVMEPVMLIHRPTEQ